MSSSAEAAGALPVAAAESNKAADPIRGSFLPSLAVGVIESDQEIADDPESKSGSNWKGNEDPEEMEGEGEMGQRRLVTRGRGKPWNRRREMGEGLGRCGEMAGMRNWPKPKKLAPSVKHTHAPRPYARAPPSLSFLSTFFSAGIPPSSPTPTPTHVKRECVLA